MTLGVLNFGVSRLGEGRIPSPLKGISFVKDGERVLFHSELSEVKESVEGGFSVGRSHGDRRGRLQIGLEVTLIPDLDGET